KKHHLMTEPSGNKPVQALPGIGHVLGRDLERSGFDMEGKMIQQYLALQRNEEEFQGWLKRICKANAKQSQDILAYLRSWCNNFL
ncbi:BAF factor, partial [Sakesphorus luctuosus]|nr:BAF factor [Sakesphorus luctuosus]